MCVRGEVCVWRGSADINRLAWKRAGRGPAHSSDSVRSSFPILMRHCEGLSSGPKQGPLGVICSRMGDSGAAGGSPWQRAEMAEVRHSTYQDGRWLNNLNGRREWHETSSRSHTGKCIVTPVVPWCQPFVCRNILLWTQRMSRWQYETILDSHTGSYRNSTCVIHGDAHADNGHVIYTSPDVCFKIRS